MCTQIRRGVAGLLAVLLLCVSGAVSAVVITYRSVDLTDAVVGEDLWRYEYSVSGSFVPFGGFNVFFSPSLYSKLQDPPAVNPDWSVGISADFFSGDALYGATAPGSNPSLADLFTLTFLWLGSGAPGSQPFEVFDDTFAIVETGQTLALNQAPLPGTLALLCIGFLALGARNTLTSLRRG